VVKNIIIVMANESIQIKSPRKGDMNDVLLPTLAICHPCRVYKIGRSTQIARSIQRPKARDSTTLAKVNPECYITAQVSTQS
jgi:hypothetical protein